MAPVHNANRDLVRQEETALASARRWASFLSVGVDETEARQYVLLVRKLMPQQQRK